MVLQMDQLSMTQSIVTVVEPLYDITGLTNNIDVDDVFYAKSSTADSVSLCIEIADHFPLDVTDDSDDCNTEQLCGLSLNPGQYLEPETHPAEDKDNPSSRDLTSRLDKGTTIHVHVSASCRTSPGSFDPGSFDGYIHNEMAANVKQANDIANDKSDIFNPSTMLVEDTASSKQLSLNQTDCQSLANSSSDFSDDHDYENCNNELSVMKSAPMSPEISKEKLHPSCPVDKCELSTSATEPNHTCKQVLASSDNIGYTPSSDRGLLPLGMTETNVGLDLCLGTLMLGEFVKSQEMPNPPIITSSCDSHMEAFEMLDDDEYVDCTTTQKTSHN